MSGLAMFLLCLWIPFILGSVGGWMLCRRLSHLEET